MEIIPPEYMIADSLVLAEGNSTDSVSDLQTQYDGNEYHINEEAGAPGLSVVITFVNILRFSRIKYSAYYKGGAAHYVEMQLWNYDDGVWEVYTAMSTGLGLNTRFFDTADPEDHVKNGEVLMRFRHIPAGNNAHDFYIDYVALMR